LEKRPKQNTQDLSRLIFITFLAYSIIRGFNQSVDYLIPFKGFKFFIYEITIGKHDLGNSEFPSKKYQHF